VSGYVCTAAMDYANENSLAFKSLPTEINGDLNGDGSVTLLDAIIAMRASVELISFDEQGIINADMNKDGNVSVYDAIMIQRLSF
ncbi:MAG: dockerin type I repeat-containing protein, partial [Acutalibacteraceae bacterium]